MNKHAILHISDFHISSPDNIKEHLRKKNYKEYIYSLSKKIKIEYGDQIDALVITGDFIDKGKTINFSYAKEIIDFICTNLNIDHTKLCLCPGNHDIIEEEDKKGKYNEARNPYYNFFDSFNNKYITLSNERARILEIGERILFLSLDSTLGEKKPYCHGKLSDTETDDICSYFFDNKEKYSDKLLIIASHFPIFVTKKIDMLVNEDDEFFGNHIWNSATRLFKRIQASRDNYPTVWLFGDVHAPFDDVENSNYYLSTGRFGGEIYDPKSPNEFLYTKQPRQARLLIISDNEQKIISFNFENYGHLDDNMLGSWKVVSNDLAVSRLSQRDKQLPDTSVLSENNIVEVISESIQKSIYENVKKNRLYKFNKYNTSSNEISLGWISVNEIFNDHAILARIVDKAFLWIQKSVSSLKETMIIGLDFWGAIIASQVSVISNVPNFCSASRGKGIHHSEIETIEEIDFFKIFASNSVKEIVIVTDVLSSGNTIMSYIETLDKFISEKGFDIPNVLVITIITDVEQKRNKSVERLKKIGTFCGNIRIPVVNNNFLPDEDILKTKLDFTK